jgi:hypothetical protein
MDIVSAIKSRQRFAGRHRPRQAECKSRRFEIRRRIVRFERAEGQALLHSAWVSIGATQMQIEDKMVNLAPGMAVTVEIKTGTRRLIEYVMSPLLRYESLRER